MSESRLSLLYIVSDVSTIVYGLESTRGLLGMLHNASQDPVNNLRDTLNRRRVSKKASMSSRVTSTSSCFASDPSIMAPSVSGAPGGLNVSEASPHSRKWADASDKSNCIHLD